ncbi:hypothetical protein C0992_010958 [Termitomyces sp. T32_za158]|nr:hypothetical protein C0992_010958 [Termitomyces sp. T32_za158]
MSDEALGAEDDNESFDDWKGQMAGFAGISGSCETLDQVKLFEIIKPEWRSKLTDLFHKLQQLWWDSLSTKQKLSYALRVTNTGRSSSVPPLVAPFDFGIDPTWWSEHGTSTEYKSIVSDWMKYPMPKAFKPLGSIESITRPGDLKVAESDQTVPIPL